MGVDILGIDPREKSGRLFMAPWHFWEPLWDRCAELAPTICAKVEHPMSNDGDGLGAVDSMALGVLLREDIARRDDLGREPLGAVEFAAFLLHCGGFEIW